MIQKMMLVVPGHYEVAFVDFPIRDGIQSHFGQRRIQTHIRIVRLQLSIVAKVLLERVKDDADLVFAEVRRTWIGHGSVISNRR
ncbi:MAG: hypothetical protein P8047_16395 [Gammaproteobacteria bacterium]